MRPKMARGVALLTLALTVFIAGCTSSTNNTSAGQHDAFLEKYLAAYQTEVKGNATFNAWEVTWVNSTAATVHFTFGNSAGNRTASTNVSMVRFQSVPEATSYVNGLGKTGYALNSAAYDASNATDESSAYVQAAGHAPTVYKLYEGTTGELLLNATIHTIEQLDDLVVTTTLTPTYTS